jgi:hypothetical protein
MKKMRKAKRRQIPNGAKSRTARNPRQRKIPDCAKSRTATKSGTAPPFGAFWDSALFGIWRRSGFRAVRDFALFGIPRR